MKKEILTHATILMIPEGMSQFQMHDILHGSAVIQRRWKIAWCLPGAAGESNGELVLSDYSFSLGR